MYDNQYLGKSESSAEWSIMHTDNKESTLKHP
jgi:hypothetical protein